ncbi:hypothetical protein BDZ89DRAFT_1060315 [Hymenopellis radicata]|nr:hypothetical protein BDZ89DRAFT_1060315 [Hymenopellis radicata]
MFNEAHLRVPELDVEFASTGTIRRPFHGTPFRLKFKLIARAAPYLASQIQRFHVLILPC